jgi:hypothetical protein
MDFTFEIAEDNSVMVYENGMAALNQPVSPITGNPFATAEEATSWAASQIAERQSWYEESGDQEPTTFGIEE